LYAEIGGTDEIYTGNGDNVAIGGFANDEIHGGTKRDILFGDSATVSYHAHSNFPKQLLSVNCSLGGPDEIYGGDGDVDYLIGGSYNDTIYGNKGMDLVFGDHASITLTETFSHKLLSATTTDHSCEGGDDTIDLGDGDDIAFGGAFSDNITGGLGQDVIFGDFGEYDAATQFLPYQNYRCIISDPNYAGGDFLYGGENDDIIFGQEGEDYIEGGDGNDDITGGHSIRFGVDTGDELRGGDGDDVILGDNGQILRIRVDQTGTNPWVHGSVWETYPEPFFVVRKVSRYDDIDHVQGNDEIHGEGGNDVLHGQRGDDVIYGEEGDDELYGELGSDELYGGPGNDILIGDIGHCVRRFSADGTPILQSDVSGTDSESVWHKDIVLEELGNITKVVRISEKVDTRVDTRELSAEDITSASLMFVANANIAAKGGWLTDLFLFDLVPGYDDILEGGNGSNVLIGQRGNDTLTGGNHNDLLIGDAGQNLIPQNTDLPRIYQVYRMLSAPAGSGYEVGPDEVDFGVIFTADFELYPSQYRFVDYLGSMIDVDTTLNDVQENSDLVKDLIGASTIAVADYCMQPMFRITPGFTSETQQLHGNDIIKSGSGSSIVIGDDIRGATPFDLTQLAVVSDLRQQLDNLVVDLSIRLSTMEVDTGFYLNPSAAPKPLIVGSDTITTDPNGQAFVTGDSLTMFGRSFLGGSLGGSLSGSLDDPETKVTGIVNRLRDIELVLLDVHFAMYELHTELLQRSANQRDTKVQNIPQFSLTLASDSITSHGDGDILIGDSAVLFTQVDRAGVFGFEFEEFSRSVSQMLTSSLRALTTVRDDARDAHILNDLDPSDGLTNKEQNGLPYADVPFLLTACTDTLNQTTAKNLGVGDYGFVGFVSCSKTSIQVTDLDQFVTSLENIRKRPAVSSFFQSLTVLKSKIPFYEKRYSSQVAKEVNPSLFGDKFIGQSTNNAMLGEFLTAIGYGNSVASDGFVFDTQARGVFDTFDNADFAQTIDGDTFEIAEGTLVDGQKGKDTFVSGGGGNVNVPVDVFAQGLFYNHITAINICSYCSGNC